MAFDPYQTWLGIPPHERPITAYRLIGVPEFESNVAAIKAGVARRAALLKPELQGEHAEAARLLAKRIASARSVLLDPDAKAAYDTELRKKQAAAPLTSPAPPVAPASGPPKAILIGGVVAIGVLTLILVVLIVQTMMAPSDDTTIADAQPIAPNEQATDIGSPSVAPVASPTSEEAVAVPSAPPESNPTAENTPEPPSALATVQEPPAPALATAPSVPEPAAPEETSILAPIPTSGPIEYVVGRHPEFHNRIGIWIAEDGAEPLPPSTSSLSMIAVRSPTLAPLASFPSARSFNLLSAPEDNRLESLDGLDSLPELAAVALLDCPNLKDVQAIGRCASLRTVRLSHTPDGIDWRPLQACPVLNQVTVEDSPSWRDLDALTGMPAVTSLSLYRMAELADLSAVATLPTLSYITLSDCPRAVDFAPLARSQTLRVVRLYQQPCDGLASLAGSPSIQTIEIELCDVPDLSPLARCPKLNELHFTHCVELADLAPLASMRSLQTLLLVNCDAVTDTTPLAGLRAIRSLHMTKCDGIQDVRFVAALPALKSLGLPPSTTTAQLGQFRSSGVLHRLEEINLIGCNQIDGIAPLRGLPQELTILLSEDVIDAVDDWSDLAGLPKLKKIHVSTNRLPPEKLERLQQGMRDDVKIETYELPDFKERIPR